ncbi:MAG: type II toxin-antitoxin system death-on-curing family toxin [Burkholderiaceae bacterium]
MSEPRWITKQQALKMHAEQLAIFGGPAGVRDEGMLESSLARPLNKFAYGETDLAALAASYAYGLARNHPFVDGNKRAAFMCMMVFLRKNGIEFEPRGPEATVAMVNLASGEITEDGLARWIRDNWPETAATKPTKATTKRAAKPAPKSAPKKRR